ncbi:ADP-ribose glycohydrolase MACROD2 isoform X2 [Hoplias malabaricus]|uniref:ADP-ribose glycohydrolase MACROD2 isoform X2 n=1 Tax=Hoplias malabaricus TaxID=27720 RepID=UPI0034625CCF
MSKKKKEWRAEKERLLSLGQEERRKEYRGNYVTLDKIATWRRHGKNTAPEEEEDSVPVALCDQVSLYKGDITVLEVDAIVNAANSSLLGGGGVDGCIHRAAGHFLYEECHSLNGCDTGKAKITCGYDLPAKYVIHTVGPIARGNVGPTQSEDLKSCYENSLKLVKDNKLRSVAFPCISTGIYGFPNEPAADIALKTVRDWLSENKDEIDRIIFCVFLETDYEIYNSKMADFFPVTEECEEDAEKTQSQDDAKEGECGDVEMLSQIVEENDTAADENRKEGKETAAEGSGPVEDEKPAAESKPEEEKKTAESEGDAGRETGGEEKTRSAAADAETEGEKEEAKDVDKEEESQGESEVMDVEEVPEVDKNTPTVANEHEVSNAKAVEVQSPDGIPPESNPAPQTDSSQSKDGLSDKNELRKE